MPVSTERTERFLRHLQPLQGRLEAFARRLLRDASEVEDALQSVVAQCFCDFDLYVEGTNFRAWIYRYLVNEICNRNRRSTRRRAEPLVAEPAAADAGAASEQESAFALVVSHPELVLEYFDREVAEGLRQLAEPERACLLLRAIGDFHYREIAEILDLPLGSVMGYLSRARRRMQEHLVEYARFHQRRPVKERSR